MRQPKAAFALKQLSVDHKACGRRSTGLIGMAHVKASDDNLTLNLLWAGVPLPYQNGRRFQAAHVCQGTGCVDSCRSTWESFAELGLSDTDLKVSTNKSVDSLFEGKEPLQALVMLLMSLTPYSRVHLFYAIHDILARY